MHDYFIENKDQVNTVLENNTDLEGELFFETSLNIRGKFKGSITTNGLLVIDSGAEVKADIKAKDLVLRGFLHGNITAIDRVEIEPTGKLYGDIKTFRLKIADNVVFEGSCEMLSQEELLKLTGLKLPEIPKAEVPETNQNKKPEQKQKNSKK